MLPHCAPNATLAGPRPSSRHMRRSSRCASTAVAAFLRCGPDQGRGHIFSDSATPCARPRQQRTARRLNSRSRRRRGAWARCWRQRRRRPPRGFAGAHAVLARHRRDPHARALVSVDALSGKLDARAAQRRWRAVRNIPDTPRSPPAPATARSTTSTTWRSRRRRSGRCACRCAPTTRRQPGRGGDGDELATLTSTAAAATTAWHENELLYLNSSIGGLAAARWPDGADPAAGAPPTLHRVWAAGAAHFSKARARERRGTRRLAARQGRADGAPCLGCAPAQRRRRRGCRRRPRERRAPSACAAPGERAGERDHALSGLTHGHTSRLAPVIQRPNVNRLGRFWSRNLQHSLTSCCGQPVTSSSSTFRPLSWP